MGISLAPTLGLYSSENQMAAWFRKVMSLQSLQSECGVKAWKTPVESLVLSPHRKEGEVTGE